MIFKSIEIYCPVCHDDLEEQEYHPELLTARDKQLRSSRSLLCQTCDKIYPLILGIPDLRVFPDPYIASAADRQKGILLAEYADKVDFAGLIDFYYQNTQVVTAKQAKSFKRGLLAGRVRAEAALVSWIEEIKKNDCFKQGALLEIGCGSGPLLVAAASQFNKIIGVDIAFRWLVVAQKRLKEAGINIPLICACAEALPFREHTFEYVVSESTIENVKNQQQVMAECHRVVQFSGYVCLSTPNRFSIGPDPHTGIPAGGYWPKRWIAAYIRRQGGIPPKRRLLSLHSLAVLFQQNGFNTPVIRLPDVPSQQRDQFPFIFQIMIRIYQLVKQVPLSRWLLFRIGPLLLSLSQKTAETLHPYKRAKAS